MGEGIVGWVAKTGESVSVADTRRDTRYLVARPATRSELACPIVSQGRIIGVFNLENDELDEPKLLEPEPLLGPDDELESAKSANFQPDAALLERCRRASACRRARSCFASTRRASSS